MRYAVLMEPVTDPGFEGYYYAHIPSLDLTTHGKGIEGALAAARELAEAWVTEKVARGEPIPCPRETLFSQIELSDALLSA